MQTHKMSLNKGIEIWALIESYAKITKFVVATKLWCSNNEKEQKLNRSEKEEIIPRYKFASPPYYREDHENAKFEQRA
jgi:hypothetical protein